MDTSASRRKLDLEATAQKVIDAIRGDDLLKIMLKEETTGQYMQQRVNEIVDYIYKADRQQLIEQLTSENERLRAEVRDLQLRCRKIEMQTQWEKDEQRLRESGIKHESSLWKEQLEREAKEHKAKISDLTREVKTLEQRLQKQKELEEDRQLQALYRSRFQSEEKNVQSEGEVLELKDELRAKKDLIIELREKAKEDRYRLEESQQAIAKLETDLRTLAEMHQKEIGAIKFGHHDEVLSLKKVANREMEQTNDVYRREKRMHDHENDYALNSLVRLHRDELDRLKLQHSVQVKSQLERIQYLQKKCQDFEELAEVSAKQGEFRSHPRFLVDEIARLNAELSLKEAVVINLNNANLAAGFELERVVSDRNQLLAELEQAKLRQLQHRNEFEKALGFYQQQAKRLRAKQEERLQIFSSQYQELVKASQKWQNKSKLFQQQNGVLTLEIGLLRAGTEAERVKERQLANALEESRRREGAGAERAALLEQSLRSCQSKIKRLTETLSDSQRFDDLLKQINTAETERSALWEAFQILKSDFEELTRVYRELHNSHKRTQQDNLALRHSLTKVNADLASSLSQTRCVERESAQAVSQLESSIQNEGARLWEQNAELRKTMVDYDQVFRDLIGFIGKINDKLARVRQLDSVKERESALGWIAAENERQSQLLWSMVQGGLGQSAEARRAIQELRSEINSNRRQMANI